MPKTSSGVVLLVCVLSLTFGYVPAVSASFVNDEFQPEVQMMQGIEALLKLADAEDEKFAKLDSGQTELNEYFQAVRPSDALSKLLPSPKKFSVLVPASGEQEGGNSQPKAEIKEIFSILELEPVGEVDGKTVSVSGNAEHADGVFEFEEEIIDVIEEVEFEDEPLLIKPVKKNMAEIEPPLEGALEELVENIEPVELVEELPIDSLDEELLTVEERLEDIKPVEVVEELPVDSLDEELLAVEERLEDIEPVEIVEELPVDSLDEELLAVQERLRDIEPVELLVDVPVDSLDGINPVEIIEVEPVIVSIKKSFPVQLAEESIPDLPVNKANKEDEYPRLKALLEEVEEPSPVVIVEKEPLQKKEVVKETEMVAVVVPETLDEKAERYFASIPAGSLRNQQLNSTILQNDVSIGRGAEYGNPFSVSASTDDRNLREDVGLKISIRTKGRVNFGILNKAYNALSGGHLEKAVELYKKILAVDEENADAQFGLAVAHHGLGASEKARKGYLQMLEKDPKYLPALNNLLVLVGDLSSEKALILLRKLQKDNPNYAVLAAQIGFIHMQRKEFGLAVDYLKRAAILDPRNLGYRYNLALLFEYVGGYEPASKLYTSILKEGIRGKRLPVSLAVLQNRIEQASYRHISKK